MQTRLSIGTLFLVVLSLIMTGCLSGKSPNSGGNGSGGSGGSGGKGGGSASLQSVSLQPLAASVAPGDTKQFKAVGHYSDGTQKDITSSSSWSSSDTTIVTIDATGLATAVASGSAKITATNGSLNGATSLNVATLSNIGISPPTPSLDPGDQQQFTAKANYSNGEGKDVTNQASWSSSDTGVATIDPATGLATAMASGKSTITATFAGQNGTTTATVSSLTSVSVSPIGPAIHAPGTPPDTQQFTATAHFDNNSTRDVTKSPNTTWSSTVPGVATVDSAGLATSVATGQTEISATFKTFSDQTALDVTSQTFSNADLNGDYVISLTGVDSRGTYFLVGTIHANGTGGITGTIDSNTVAGVKLAQTVVGNYTVFPDGRGDVHIAGSISGASASHQLRFVLTATKTTAQVIEFDTTTVSAGKIEQESGSPFTLSSLNGTYTFGQGGIDAGVSTTGAPHAAVGTFTSDGAGNITGGQEDVNDNGIVSNAAFSASSYSQPDSNIGRYLVALTTSGGTSNFVFYLVSPSKAYFISTDATPSPVQGGLAQSQATTTLANSSYVFLTDVSGTAGQFHIAGQITLNAGNVTGGEQDETPAPNLVTITGGSYTASGGGRYTLCETISTTCDRNFLVYVVSASRFFMLRSDASDPTKVAMGAADAQSSSTMAAGTYGLTASALSAIGTARGDNALLTTDGSTTISGIGDRNDKQVISSLTLSGGTFALLDSAGRGTFTVTEPGSVPSTYIFYVVSGSKVIVIGESPNTDGVMNSQ